MAQRIQDGFSQALGGESVCVPAIVVVNNDSHETSTCAVRGSPRIGDTMPHIPVVVR
jgi:hypothetical protein